MELRWWRYEFVTDTRRGFGLSWSHRWIEDPGLMSHELQRLADRFYHVDWYIRRGSLLRRLTYVSEVLLTAIVRHIKEMNGAEDRFYRYFINGRLHCVRWEPIRSTGMLEPTFADDIKIVDEVIGGPVWSSRLDGRVVSLEELKQMYFESSGDLR